MNATNREAARKAAHRVELDAQLALMHFEPPRRDNAGRLLPLRPIGECVARGMAFLFDGQADWLQVDGDTLVDEDGVRHPAWFFYSNLRQDGRAFGHAKDTWVAYPARHHAAFIETFLDWAARSGDTRAIGHAVDLADWNLAHSTPRGWLYGGMPYSTWAHGQAGGHVDGAAIMPDKAAQLGAAYLRLAGVTGTAAYRDAALHIAARLAATQRDDGSWPFRVEPESGRVCEDYSSSQIYALEFLEQVDRALGDARYREARERCWAWLLAHPIRDMLWRGYFEDIPAGEGNRTNFDCIDTVRYLIGHRECDPAYLDHARRLHDWIAETFGERGHPYAPALGIREQKACFTVMAAHSAHFGYMQCELAAATGDARLAEEARQTLAYVSYHQQDDGRLVTSIDYVNGARGGAFFQFWFAQHVNSLRYLMASTTLEAGAD